jgi:hypothetical protein
MEFGLTQGIFVNQNVYFTIGSDPIVLGNSLGGSQQHGVLFSSDITNACYILSSSVPIVTSVSVGTSLLSIGNSFSSNVVISLTSVVSTSPPLSPFIVPLVYGATN